MRFFVGGIGSLGIGRSRKSKSLWSLAAALAVVALLAIQGTKSGVSAADDDLFSSNVVALTSANWKQHVSDNPHMVLINICRKGEWEKLAASVKGMVTIAYWDTQGGSRPPRLLGEYSGTPTIRLFSPKRKPKKAGSFAEKTVLDYSHGERNAGDMRKFLEYQLPNYVERIKFGKEDYDRLAQKAQKFGLPLVVVFTTKAKTSTTLKWLSAEYRRKLLLVEVPPTDNNHGLREEIFGGVADAEDASAAAAALYVIPPAALQNSDSKNKIVFYGGEGKKFTRRKLQDFLEQYALSEPALEPVAAGNAAGGSEETAKEKVDPQQQQQQQQHDEF